MTKKISAFICIGPIFLSLFVKYLIYGPHEAVKYSIYGPKNIFRIGNIIHRVVRKRSLWIGTMRNLYFFLQLSLFDCMSYVTFSLACVGISILVYAPPPGSIYSDPMSGAPDNCQPQ
jgi:hypothetical protein